MTRTLVLQSMVVSLLLVSSAHGALPSATYHNGPVLANVEVEVVFWGPNVSSETTSNIPAFLRTLVDSGYIDWLGEYFSSSAVVGPIGRGNVFDAVTITPNHTSSVLTQSDVESELGQQIAAGHLLKPNANSLYMIYFPPGVQITNVQACKGSSCVAWKGCHLNTTQNGATFAYAMLPDLSNNCGGSFGTPLDDQTLNSSHELAEAITDPYNNSGWRVDPGDGKELEEIADACAGQQDTIVDANGKSYVVQTLWSHVQNNCIAKQPDCQRISDTFGVTPNTPGFAPPEVLEWFSITGCTTSPQSSSDWCQKISEIYGTTANVTWGYAPPNVQQYWQANNCNTAPLDRSVSLCQRASDTFGLNQGSYAAAGGSWGAAPDYIRTWWNNSFCDTVPHALDACQKFADHYGTIANVTWGFAPSNVWSWWQSNNCNARTTTSMAQQCQNAANEFAIVGGQSWGGAPPEVQRWWGLNGCNAAPNCQEVTELFGSFAAAPDYVLSWWWGTNCRAAPLFTGDLCQLVADTWGIVANYSWGFSPDRVQSWWGTVGCDSHPRSDSLRQLQNG
jgi:hypothetical protein